MVWTAPGLLREARVAARACVCASFVKCPPALYVCCGVTNVLVGRPRCVDLAAQEVSHHQLIQLEAPQNHQNRRDRRPSSRSWPTRSVKRVGRGKRNRREGGVPRRARRDTSDPARLSCAGSTLLGHVRASLPLVRRQSASRRRRNELRPVTRSPAPETRNELPRLRGRFVVCNRV